MPEGSHTRQISEPANAGSARREWRPLGDGSAILIEELDDVERVGGRHRIRGEFVLMVAGFLFLAGAFLKPWAGNAGPSASAAPSSAAIVAAATANPGLSTPAASHSAVPTLAAAPFAGLGIASPLAADWRSLAVADRHSGWGVATATVSTGRLAAGASGVPVPNIRWEAVRRGSSAAEIAIDPIRVVYAVAITWPAGFDARDVVFIYKGPGPSSGVYYENPMVRQPAREMKPLPAAAVATSPPIPTPSPSTIRSGQFWVAPPAGPPVPDTSSAAEAWRVGPWAWPTGDYEVVVATPADFETLELSIGPYG